ncbi:MAG: division/cell wall cluster transcriptional repressor MraZ [Weeksellaceae bacterium]
MIPLTESYECKVDAKGRLPMPVGLKKQWASILNNGFVLKRSVFYPCLELLPLSEWEKTMAEINQLNVFVRKNKDFIRHYTAGVKMVEVDGNGRIQIPRELVAFAGISKNIVLAPSVNIMEIWDKDKYESSLQIDEEDFAVLAEEVMGGIKKDETDVS